MNARELLNDLESGLIDEFMSAEVKAIYIRALRLLAAAEEEGAPRTAQIAAGIDKMRHADKREVEYAYRDAIISDVGDLERERNGLAARVRELEKDMLRLARGFYRLTKNMDIGELIDYDSELGHDTKELRPIAEAITFGRDAERGSKP